jgi:glycogen synthase
LPNRGDVITAAKGEENRPTGQRGYGTKNMLYYEDFVTTVIEQSDREEYEKILMNFYVDVSSTTSRNAECIQNIIDMNIVPFNIHMLMRDVPLINVYNYDYSFGKFVDEFLQTRNNTDFNTLNTKQLFA